MKTEKDANLEEEKVKNQEKEYDLTGIGDPGALLGVSPEDEESSDKSDNSDNPDSFNPSGQASLAAKLLGFAAGILSGEITEEEVQGYLDASEAKRMIEEAYQRGLIEGRNEQIEERIEVLPVGAPDLCGAPPATGKSTGSIFDLARLAQ